VLPASPPLLTPHPPAAPLLPPLHVIDLMTAEGSAAFAATWRVREAKLVECPALGDAMPEFPTTYDIEPHAEERGFDDSDWTVVSATDLGRRRGGGMVSFCWYRSTLTVPVNALGFDTAAAMAVLRVNVTTTPRSGSTARCHAPPGGPVRTRSRVSTCRTASC
jgi:hypothetical protein